MYKKADLSISYDGGVGRFVAAWEPLLDFTWTWFSCKDEFLEEEGFYTC